MTEEEVIKSLGAELSLRVLPVPDPDLASPPLSVLRGKARAKVATCTACTRRDACSAPVAFTGSSPARYIVLMDAPDREDDRARKAGVGKDGRALRAMLKGAGLNVNDAMFMYVNACYSPDKAKEEEQAACRENLFAQLQASWCQMVLLVGANAIRAWRHDMKVERVTGNVYVWDDQFIVIPAPHPGSLKHNAELKLPMERAVRTLASIVSGETPALSHMDDICIHCDTYLSHIDADGVGYCDEHWQAGKHERDASRERWESIAGTNRLL